MFWLWLLSIGAALTLGTLIERDRSERAAERDYWEGWHAGREADRAELEQKSESAERDCRFKPVRPFFAHDAKGLSHKGNQGEANKR